MKRENSSKKIFPRKKMRVECPCGKYTKKADCGTCSPHLFCPLNLKKQKTLCNHCGGGKPRKNKKCHHGVTASFCLKCPGKAICEHKKRRCRCKECIITRCRHENIPSCCYQCRPNNKKKCPHHKKKSTCIKCNPKLFCIPHKSRIYDCVLCGVGGGICEHKKRRGRCEECIKDRCKHGNIPTECYYCIDRSCSHMKDKRSCKICGGSNICKPHGNFKMTCIACKGINICEGCGITSINKVLSSPVEYALGCFGTRLCATCNPTSIRRSRYNKSRPEIKVWAFLEEHVQMHIIHDQPVGTPCGLRTREDLVLPKKSEDYFRIVEVDEHAHQRSTELCEWSKVLTSVYKYQAKRVLFIRFNPDHVRWSAKASLQTRLKTLKKVIEEAEDVSSWGNQSLRVFFLYYPNKKPIHEATSEDIERAIRKFAVPR